MTAKRTLASAVVLPAFLAVSCCLTGNAKPLPEPTPLADKNKPVTDDFLYDTIRRKLASDAVIKGGALDLDVKDGVVTLKGTVETERQKDKAEKVVKKISGVKSVVNQIQISHP